MKKTIILIGLLAGLAVPGLDASAQDLAPAVRRQMDAIRADKATRTPVERKLDSQLQYLAREAAGMAAVRGAPALAARVDRANDGRVRVEIAAQPSADLRTAIINAGGTIVYESPRWSFVTADLPPTSLLGLAARPDVRSIKPADRAIVHTGSVVNEADAAQRVAFARATFDVTGAGVKVGVISNSDDHSEASVANGELPRFTVLAGRDGRPASGEGTAMSEIVADLAPGASIYFAAAGPSKAFMADSILALRAAGCSVIVDDISFLAEWQFQDDEIAQAVNQVVGDGAVYLSSAGNEGNLERGTSSTWEGDFVDGEADDLFPEGRVHSFGAQRYNQLTAGSDAIVLLQWSDEARTSANDYDLFILDAEGNSVVSASNNTQDGNDEPIEAVSGVNPEERIVIVKADAAAPRYLRLIAPCCGARLEVATAGQTIGHASTPGCITVGASDASVAAPGSFTASSRVEDSTSDGPRKMFYNPDGTLINPAGGLLASGGVNIATPALTAGDGGSTSVPGFNPFYGTSAAAPAAAAVAALVRSRQPSLTGARVREILESSCLDIEALGFDNLSGNGIVMADLALARTCPETLPPVVTVPANIRVAATSASGAVVNFVATASDACDGPRAVTCVPASGSTFPVGTRNVTCTATDAQGRAGSGTFTVRVDSTGGTAAINQIRALISQLSSMAIPADVRVALLLNLNMAESAMRAGQPAQACTALRGFETRVSLFRNRGSLTQAQAGLLLASSQRIRSTIGCR